MTHATPEQFMGNLEPPVWKTIESYAGQNDVFSAALLSIKARVEQLEANSQPTPNPSQIRSSAEGGSLVERVNDAITLAVSTAIGEPTKPLSGVEARAAIREVAIWLMERGYRTQSLLLNDEALSDD